MDASVIAAIKNGLLGRMSHVSAQIAFEDLDWELAGKKPEGCSHTIWQLLNHLIYWQEYCRKLLAGEKPVAPEHAAESWVEEDGPEDASTFGARVTTFLHGIGSLDADVTTGDVFERELPGDAKHSQAEVLMSLIGHNSYHLGQVVQLRQQLGSWPPPSGGETW